MIELKVIVEDDNRAEELLHELNSQKGVSARVSPKAYETGDENNSSSVSEPITPQGPSVNADLFNEATHFFDGENLYVTRRYYEDYIRDMAYNFAHPEELKNEPLRTVSAEELADCITLDEFRNELTEMIHKHYHPQA
ncbi:MAG: hypothetical protein K6A67_03030 [Bacteroidales bacterium]|nr:hypothetical protein [Bacteroidales bacterium]